jgi:hypothetical protein
VGTDAAGNDYVFYGGSDYGLLEKWYIASNSTWYGPSVILKLPSGDVAGVNTNAMAVAVYPNGDQDVFWQGDGNQDLYELSYVPGSGGARCLRISAAPARTTTTSTG